MTERIVLYALVAIVVVNVGILVWAFAVDWLLSRRARALARLQAEQQRDYEEASRG